MSFPGFSSSSKPLVHRILGLAFYVLWFSIVFQCVFNASLLPILFGRHWNFLILLGLVIGLQFSCKISLPQSNKYLLVALVLLIIQASIFAWSGNYMNNVINIHNTKQLTELFIPSIHNINYWSIVGIINILLVSGLIGVWLKQESWLDEYHFKYKLLRFWFFFSLGALLLWFILHYFGVYKWVLTTFLGRVIFSTDYFIIQFVLTYILLFILIYLENFKRGLKTLRFIENSGAKWYLHVLLMALWLLLANNWPAFKPIYLIISALLLAIFPSLLHTKSKN